MCLAGGEREVGIAGYGVRMARKLAKQPVEIEQVTIKRQCDNEFIKDLAPAVERSQAVVSFGCAAGVQAMAERFPGKPVYPGPRPASVAKSRPTSPMFWACRSYEHDSRSCPRSQLRYPRFPFAVSIDAENMRTPGRRWLPIVPAMLAVGLACTRAGLDVPGGSNESPSVGGVRSTGAIAGNGSGGPSGGGTGGGGAGGTDLGQVVHAWVGIGFESTCAIRADGTLACWGVNLDGEATPPGGTFIDIAMGDHFGCGVRTDRSFKHLQNTRD